MRCQRSTLVLAYTLMCAHASGTVSLSDVRGGGCVLVLHDSYRKNGGMAGYRAQHRNDPQMQPKVEALCNPSHEIINRTTPIRMRIVS